MNQSHKTQKRHRIVIATAAVLVAGLAALQAYASTSQVFGSGAIEYTDAVGGPTTVTMRTLTIAPGEVLGWHDHPGTVYTVVVSGTLTVEDGCGSEVTYAQGQGFIEPPHRTHRGKNLTGANVVTAQTFLMPLGTPTTHPHTGQLCGEPQVVEECKNDGWRRFDLPRDFLNEGDCVKFIQTDE